MEKVSELLESLELERSANLSQACCSLPSQKKA
jgi:hypothetical protein